MAAYSGGYLKSLPQQSYDQNYKKFLDSTQICKAGQANARPYLTSVVYGVH
jgi:hypothetical protein